MIEKNITGWNFDNSYARLPEIFYANVQPTPVSSPKLVALNYHLAAELGLDGIALQTAGGVSVLSGNQLPQGSLPLAQAYAGHQFGHFTMLGDGRALLLGEHITPDGKRVDIQLKGSGRTPYSRGGDGRAALGPMLREYIISEAMYALGIPTTRSLAVATTGESVFRETELPGAVLTRVSASHLRVGTFEYASKWGSVEELRALADYTLQRHYALDSDIENPYLFLLKEVMKRQAVLISQWQLVGFIHGVMNTDNMTISGETIDYGPCAFMDAYDPATVFSSIDSHGRYAYGNQPQMGGWDLARLAEALLPLLHDNEDKALALAQKAISEFPDYYQSSWISGMRAKLGLLKEEEQDLPLIKELLSIMLKYHADYTNTFRALTNQEEQEPALAGTPEFIQWYNRWQKRLERLEKSKAASLQLMKQSNPAVIPRNHCVEDALEAAQNKGDYSKMEKLLHVVTNPFAYSSEPEDYYTMPSKSSCGYRTFCGT